MQHNVDPSSLPEGFRAAGNPEEEARLQEQEEQKQSILKQILTPEAFERLGRVKLTRREKATQLETQLIQMAMRGELQKQIAEPDLIALLETASKQQSKITIKRRNFLDDDDDDNDDDLL